LHAHTSLAGRGTLDFSDDGDARNSVRAQTRLEVDEGKFFVGSINLTFELI